MAEDAKTTAPVEVQEAPKEQSPVETPVEKPVEKTQVVQEKVAEPVKEEAAPKKPVVADKPKAPERKPRKQHREAQSIEDADYDAAEVEGQLCPTDLYLRTGIHVGTKFKTKDMAPFIYKTRPDGLSVLNVQLIDERAKLSYELIKNYEPEEILIVCRRENGWKPLHLLNKLTGMKSFAGRYPPGILTNSNLETFMEVKLMIVVDAWADRNALRDAIKVGIPVIGLCDTNNQCTNIDLVVPCNNKGRKSLGLYFYLMAREYLLAKGKIKDEKELTVALEEFLED
ncbi:MAG: small subunit ribosomal protein S2 [Candidatus Woesearchaeota archaeon]|jgi:small subunit ribosomal protein S2